MTGKRKRLTIQQRRAHALARRRALAELHGRGLLAGLTLTEIADALADRGLGAPLEGGGVAPYSTSTIDRDVSALRDEQIEHLLTDRQHRKAERVAQLEHLYRTAMNPDPIEQIAGDQLITLTPRPDLTLARRVLADLITLEGLSDPRVLILEERSRLADQLLDSIEADLSDYPEAYERLLERYLASTGRGSTRTTPSN